MLRDPAFAVNFVTGYLVLYVVLFQTDAPEGILTLLFALSPLLVIWMAVTILKHGKYQGPPLGDDEEWGYQDVDKEKL